MPTERTSNREQDEYWNGEEATHWIAHLDRYDAMLAPFHDHLFERADVNSAATVLDVGCGCGATTLAAADLAVDGLALGADLSAPMLEIAAQRARRRRVDNARFEQGDVEFHPFEPEGFEHAVSRFGVMFFANPVDGFSNIARALRPEGRLTFVCWQELARNDWMVIPGAAAAAHVSLPPLAGGDAPGPFFLADPDRIYAVLVAAGFQSIDIAPVEVALALGASVEDAVGFLAQTGMGRTLLADVDDETRLRALEAMANALTVHMGDGGVELGSRAWLVSARK